MSFDQAYAILENLARDYDLEDDPIFNQLLHFQARLRAQDRFFSLPPELRNKIANYLPKSDVLTLNQTYADDYVVNETVTLPELMRFPPGTRVKGVVLHPSDPDVPPEYRWRGLKIQDFRQFQYLVDMASSIYIFESVEADVDRRVREGFQISDRLHQALDVEQNRLPINFPYPLTINYMDYGQLNHSIHLPANFTYDEFAAAILEIPNEAYFKPVLIYDHGWDLGENRMK